MKRVTWTYTKEYTDEDFQENFSEHNDVQYRGYVEIIKDYESIDSSDDMHLEFDIEEFTKDEHLVL